MTMLIFPEPPERLKEMAKELLALADSPSHVEFVMWPESGFRVPEELFVRYAATRESEDSEIVEEKSEIVEEKSEPVKRKPGRPKKEAQ